MDKKYKIGDSVRIREWDDMAITYGLDNSGCINVLWKFIPRMKKHCGTEDTITDIIKTRGGDVYLLANGQGKWFSHEMFEDGLAHCTESELSLDISFEDVFE